MMTELGIVADDVTGGTTVGALLAREGIEPTLCYDARTMADIVSPNEDVIITSTDSRAMKPEEAYKAVREATQSLLSLGATQFSKRIDTTMRGNIGAEVEGMLSALNDDYVALVVPAMPQSKKVMIGGYLLIDSIPLAMTDVAHDVRTPVVLSDVRNLVQSQMKQKVAYVPVDDVVLGAHTIAAQLLLQQARGCRVFVIDAATLQEIQWIAEAVVDLGWKVVAVDPGPFTLALAMRHNSIHPSPRPDRSVRTEASKSDKGIVLTCAGSATKTTRMQMMRLAAEPGTAVLSVDPMKLISNKPSVCSEEMQRVKEQARQILSSSSHQPRVVLLAVDNALEDKLPAKPDELTKISGLPAEEASNLITEKFSEVARTVANIVTPERCAGFYLTGGDTTVRFCKAIEAQGLHMVDYLIPQVDQSVIVGGPFSGTPVICKGGLTGVEETSLQVVNRLFDQQHVQINQSEKATI